jgi:hypothetical protein
LLLGTGASRFLIGLYYDDSELEDVTVSDLDLLAQRFETHREPVQE